MTLAECFETKIRGFIWKSCLEKNKNKWYEEVTEMKWQELKKNMVLYKIYGEIF
jgi:hypothetical protein